MSFRDRLSQISDEAQARVAAEKEQREKAEALMKKTHLEQQRPAMLALKSRLMLQAEAIAKCGSGVRSFIHEVDDISAELVPELIDLLRKEDLYVSFRLVKTRDMIDNLVELPELTISW